MTLEFGYDTVQRLYWCSAASLVYFVDTDHKWLNIALRIMGILLILIIAFNKPEAI
ncbi:hypothetical protein PP935_gp177 [Rhizobium phage RHph_N34]|uniref:Uncharacterized protein n=1 Tax=Rhizobium phage RHph_N34 TaxID=2509586 RepID=A0A7S5RA61_9CAUD|nr:hypothetical protein PP935_gp177 [Rhizobium phage RHph_N34]QIG73952.1 hypothetical protein EVC06_177 [Rhizobium phage RHph_N34]